MFYIIYFNVNQSWNQFTNHIIQTYPALLNDEVEFIKKDNILTSIITSSFSISIRKGSELNDFNEIIDQYECKCDYRFALDIISDSPNWEKDLILVTDDILRNCQGDLILLQCGETVMIQRKNNLLYVEKDKAGLYPFEKLSQSWS